MRGLDGLFDIDKKVLRDYLTLFQECHYRWLEHNFPDQKPADGLLGLVEEVGELAHAHLKADQGIRGISRQEYRRQARDAVGDIFIYLMSYCNTNGISMAGAILEAWEEVSERDWQRYPETGKPPTGVRDPADQEGTE